jgi:hypothetical protein
VWTHHSAYDYVVLLLPLAYLFSRPGDLGYYESATIVTSVALIWFVQRLIDSASDTSLFAIVRQVSFWSIGLGIYAALFISALKPSRPALLQQTGISPQDLRADSTTSGLARLRQRLLRSSHSA